MNEIKDIARADRCPGISYTDMLNGDTRRPPDYLFEETTIEMGNEPLSVAPYISEDFARLEREKMWPNVWLFAAREDELPDPGDTVVFDIAGKSFLLIRQKDGGVKAFYNACLHRGRKLRVAATPQPNGDRIRTWMDLSNLEASLLNPALPPLAATGDHPDPLADHDELVDDPDETKKSDAVTEAVTEAPQGEPIPDSGPTAANPGEPETAALPPPHDDHADLQLQPDHAPERESAGRGAG